MSVVRSAYRQILRVGARARKSYEDPNDLCFAIFGILLNRNDFANAGYGTSFVHTVRHAFERSSVVGDATDSPSARLQASFSFLRRLNDLSRYKTPSEVRQRRQKVLGKTSVAAKSPLVATPVEEEVEVKVKDGVPTVTKKSAISQSRTTTSSEKSSRPAAATEEAGKTAEGEEDDAEESGDEDDDDDDENVLVGTTTLLIDRSQNRKLQQGVRHMVISKVQMEFPPYPYLLPPEPMYPLTLRHEFPFLLVKDAVACLAATSRLLQRQQTKREQEEAAELGYSSPKSVDPHALAGAGLATSSFGDGSNRLTLDFPTTPQGFQAMLNSIPTRAVARTDFMEVEVCTQYISSHAGGSGMAPSAAAAVRGSSRPLPPPPSELRGQRGSGGTTPGKAGDGTNLFICYVFIRNLSPSQNRKMWHAQILSRHFTLLDPERNEVVDMANPGVVGNFPLLAPGESHVFEAGTRQHSADGVLRGTLQVTAFNEQGQMRSMDVALPPVRLSTRVFDYPYHKGYSAQAAAATSKDEPNL